MHAIALVALILYSMSVKMVLLILLCHSLVCLFVIYTTAEFIYEHL